MRWPRLAQIGPDWPSASDWAGGPSLLGRLGKSLGGEEVRLHARRSRRVAPEEEEEEGRERQTTEIVMATLEERTEKHGKTDGKDDGCTLLDFHGSAPPSQTLLSLQNTPIQT